VSSWGDGEGEVVSLEEKDRELLIEVETLKEKLAVKLEEKVVEMLSEMLEEMLREMLEEMLGEMLEEMLGEMLEEMLGEMPVSCRFILSAIGFS